MKRRHTVFQKLMRAIIPAPLYHVVRRDGLGRLFKMLVTVGLSYTQILVYLLRKRGIRAAWNFLSVKLFTPVGPGSAGLFWFFAGWLIRRYPLLYRFPRQLELEITTECSKKCIHCEHTWWKNDSQLRQHMPPDQVIKILKQFPNLRWVSLVGEGTSFEHPDMLTFIKYVKSREIMCYMVDHLSDWTEDTLKTVMDYDLDGLSISLDAATKKTYEQLKVGCDFDNVTTNIKKLVALKKQHRSPLPEIMFTFIAMQKNVAEIPEYVDLIASLGTRREFGPGSRIGVVRLLAFKQILHLQIDDIPQPIIHEAQQRARRNDLFINFTGTNKQEDLPDPSCCLAWMEPYIFMGGYISQCCAVFISNNRNFIRKYALGNVLEKDFRNHWDGPAYRMLRNYVNKPERPIPIQCAGCRIFNTLPREKKYGIINTHSGEIISLEKFYHEYMGENMKWRYQTVMEK